MFPNTQKIDDQLADITSRGITPFNSNEARMLKIAQAAAWFPKSETMDLVEEHLVERRIIPPSKKKK